MKINGHKDGKEISKDKTHLRKKMSQRGPTWSDTRTISHHCLDDEHLKYVKILELDWMPYMAEKGTPFRIARTYK